MRERAEFLFSAKLTDEAELIFERVKEFDDSGRKVHENYMWVLEINGSVYAQIDYMVSELGEAIATSINAVITYRLNKAIYKLEDRIQELENKLKCL